MFLLAMWRLYTVSLTLAVPAMHCLHKTKGFRMALTLEDVYNQADYLVGQASGLSIYMQDYEEEEGLVLEYDDGEPYAVYAKDTPVEATSHGTILILGTEYRAYVAQQVKFNPEQE